jgi:hypothetical protein
LKQRYDTLFKFKIFDLRRFVKAGRTAESSYVFTVDARHPGRAVQVDPWLLMTAINFSI